MTSEEYLDQNESISIDDFISNVGEYPVEPKVAKFIEDFNLELKAIQEGGDSVDNTSKIINLKQMLTDKIIAVSSEMEKLIRDTNNSLDYLDPDSAEVVLEDDLAKQMRSNLVALCNLNESVEGSLLK